tara:strand:- start:137 stop:433 length:297 start_codon:yes stop_codon:yes gene_type:complete
MVRIAWSEYLHKDEPSAIIELEFCSDGAKHMKQITNFVMWIERNTGFEYESGVNWSMRKHRNGYEIDVKFSCLTMYHLKRINNKFRSLTTKLYHSEDK